MFQAFHAVTVCVTVACAAQGMSDASANPNANPWDLITAIEYTETESNGEWQVKKTFPPELRAMATAFEITGYYVPIEAQGYVTQFLLVPDPADCPFCGAGGYGPTLEVKMKRPMPDVAEASELTVRGTLNFDRSTETYRALFLTDGRLVN